MIKSCIRHCYRPPPPKCYDDDDDDDNDDDELMIWNDRTNNE